MSLEVENKLVELAVDKFKNGLYCSEAILAAFNEICNLKLSNDVLKIATAFGTGFGGAKCVCGSLTAGQMVISLVQGRSDASESEEPAFASAKRLHDEFKKEFKGTCCRILTKDVIWGAPEHHKGCIQYVEGAVRITYQIIQEHLPN